MGDSRLFTKTQHNAAFTLLDNIKTSGQPNDKQYSSYQPGTESASGRGATAVTFAALATSEQAAELALEFAYNFIEVLVR